MAASRLTGGAALDTKLRELTAKVKQPGTLNVGFLAGATYPDGRSVGMVAAIQEFGAPKAGIPPRPFFRTMIAAHSPEWGEQIGKILVAADYDATVTMGRMGEVISGELQESIADLTAPALSPVTVMLRAMRSADQSLVVTGKTVGEAARRVRAGISTNGASTKPLIDSGHLRQSVDYEVKA